jgi:hypothetical protein
VGKNNLKGTYLNWINLSISFCTKINRNFSFFQMLFCVSRSKPFGSFDYWEIRKQQLQGYDMHAGKQEVSLPHPVFPIWPDSE